MKGNLSDLRKTAIIDLVKRVTKLEKIPYVEIDDESELDSMRYNIALFYVNQYPKRGILRPEKHHEYFVLHVSENNQKTGGNISLSYVDYYYQYRFDKDGISVREGHKSSGILGGVPDGWSEWEDITKSVDDKIIKEILDRIAADTELETALETHKNDKSNPHGVTKAQVGLGNVDNTSDLNKPVSTAVRAAIEAEKTARESADSALRAAIDVEAQERMAVDEDMQLQINTIKDDTDALSDKVFGRGTPKTWKDVQHIVRSGRAAQYFNIGDQFVVEKLIGVTASVGNSAGIAAVTVDANEFVDGIGETKAGEYVFAFDNHSWHDASGGAVQLPDYGITVTGTPKAGDTMTVTETTEELVWDVIGIDHDTPADETYTHSMTLQLHDVLPENMEFDAAEAIWYIDEKTYPSGLAAGTYNFVFKTSGKKQFTLAKPVPIGGHIVIDRYDANINTYISATSMTPIETAALTAGSEGVTLSTPSMYYSTAPTSNTNTINCSKGDDWWGRSALRQWLNTKKSANEWWEPQTIFDRPPAYRDRDGFLNKIDAAFLEVIGKVIKTTNDYDYTGGRWICKPQISEERFFLLSLTEVFCAGVYGATAEGEAYSYYGANYSDLSEPGVGVDKNRNKYRNYSTNICWELRSCHDTSPGVFTIANGGSRGNSIAPMCSIENGYTLDVGIAPACVIV